MNFVFEYFPYKYSQRKWNKPKNEILDNYSFHLKSFLAAIILYFESCKAAFLYFFFCAIFDYFFKFPQ